MFTGYTHKRACYYYVENPVVTIDYSSHSTYQHFLQYVETTSQYVLVTSFISAQHLGQSVSSKFARKSSSFLNMIVK